MRSQASWARYYHLNLRLKRGSGESRDGAAGVTYAPECPNGAWWRALQSMLLKTENMANFDAMCYGTSNAKKLLALGSSFPGTPLEVKQQYMLSLWTRASLALAMCSPKLNFWIHSLNRAGCVLYRRLRVLYRITNHCTYMSAYVSLYL